MKLSDFYNKAFAAASVTEILVSLRVVEAVYLYGFQIPFRSRAYFT